MNEKMKYFKKNFISITLQIFTFEETNSITLQIFTFEETSSRILPSVFLTRLYIFESKLISKILHEIPPKKLLLCSFSIASSFEGTVNLLF